VPSALAHKIIIDEDADFIRTIGDEKEAILIVKGIHCAACIWLIEQVIGNMAGVRSARLNFSSHKLHLKWEPQTANLKDIIKKIGSIGYEAAPFTDEARDALLEKRRSDLLIKMIVAGFGTAATVFFADGLYAGFFWGIEAGFRDFMQWASLAVAIPVVLFSSSIFVRGALAGLRHRSLTMDLPVALGAVITLIYSSWATIVGRGDVYFDSACMFVFLILLGRYFEAMARRKAANESLALKAFEKGTATLIEEGERRSVAIGSIKAGDIIEVAPGEGIALDGVIVEGGSTIDESMLTGESRPVCKDRGGEVWTVQLPCCGRSIAVWDGAVYSAYAGSVIKLAKDNGSVANTVIWDGEGWDGGFGVAVDVTGVYVTGMHGLTGLTLPPEECGKLCNKLVGVVLKYTHDLEEAPLVHDGTSVLIGSGIALNDTAVYSVAEGVARFNKDTLQMEWGIADAGGGFIPGGAERATIRAEYHFEQPWVRHLPQITDEAVGRPQAEAVVHTHGCEPLRFRVWQRGSRVFRTTSHSH